MADAVAVRERGAPPARPARRFALGLARAACPFFLFSFAFMILPTVYLVIGSFQKDGQLTPPELRRPQHRDHPAAPSSRASRSASSRRSPAASSASCWPTRSSSAGCRGSCGRRVMTFSGVASNFAGVPLALAFIFTLGQLGPRHRRSCASFGFDLYDERTSSSTRQARPRARLPVLPDPADGPDHRAGHRRPEEGVARGRREHGRDAVAVLAPRRPADPDAVDPRAR